MKKAMTRIFVLALLMMVSMGAWADVKVVYGEDGEDTCKFTGGEITASVGEEKGGEVTVTLTVAPDDGYTITKDDIEVYATMTPNGTRADDPQISGTLELKGDDPKDLSEKRDYTVTVKSTFGVWVKGANFQENGSKAEPTRVDYSGVYYIANNNTNAYVQNAGTNWYMVPASNGGDENVSKTAWTYNNDANTPLVTTYQTQKNENSIWVVEKSGDYYHIIHALTGMYMVYNAPVYNNRRAFHLESTDSPGETALYAITYQSSSSPSYYNIRYNKLTTSNRFLNPSKGNKAYYYGLTADNQTEVAGIIGIYSDGADKGSMWFLENALLSAPTITYNYEDNNFTISYDKIPVGFDILYTTDGSDPTINGSTTNIVTTTTERSTTVEVTGRYTVKAVVARYGLVLTEVASQLVGIPDDPTITPPSDCNNLVEMSAGGATIYYTLDGTDPDNSSNLYSEPFALNKDVTIKAVSYNGNIRSANIITQEYTPPYTVKPIISRNGITVIITGSGTIYYTDDGTDPDANSTPYTGAITLSDGSGTKTFKAVAKDDSKGLSCVAELTINLGYFINDLTKLQDITSHLSERCIITNYIDASDFNASISGFTGIFDGGYYTISGLTVPLFDNLNGGTVKNVVLSEVFVSGNGAICNTADGATKIYNCGVLSGTVNGTGNVGGLVGQINSGSSVRVVNCYNFAEVKGGTTMAGIVGNNLGTVGNVRIALCMMYGKMAGTSPVYAGNHVSNVQKFTEYNYWRYRSGLTYSTYNDQLAIDKDEYLTRFPFYRHILNTHRELAAYFLFADNTTTGSVDDITSEQVAEIGHWVLDKSKAPYPIIEEWRTNTRKVIDAPARATVNVGDDNHSITSLSVTIKIDGSQYTASLPITGMDEANYDYTWGKVVLPFANEFKINTDYSKICTGWKITSITGGKGATFENYNFSDRNCTDKDLYETSGYIYAQGGNYIVPYGVTAITIEANFATAYYLSDPAYDIGLNANYGGAANLGGTVPTTYYQDRPVAINLETLLTNMPTADNPHEQAIVLVGNYHFNDGDLGSGNYEKAFTLMSIDADNNQEPDYGFYAYNSADRPGAPSMRFDFLPVIPVGMAAHVNGSTGFPGVPIWKVRGWFEMTETCVFYTSQCEIDSGNFNSTDNGRGNNRWIVNSGYFVQIVRSRDKDCNRVSYIHMGGNVFVEEFYPGSHSDKDKTTTIVPVNVTGGEIKECFMTGYSSQNKVKAQGDDIYFWCAGGKIHKFLGAYVETPTPKTSGAKVNMTAKIDHAIIGRYFGGGTSAKASIGGNITTTINNSKVDFFCGGPEFSSATEAPVVVTNATNTIFGEYYGAGYGGTSITYARVDQQNSVDISNDKTYPISFGYVYKRLNKTSDGIGTCYKFEYIYHSYSRVAVARSYTGYAQFSLATTGNVTNNLTGCQVSKLTADQTLSGEGTTGDFYGAGCQGKVSGTVNSTLTSCEIDGSAYGGGFKAESNEVKVYTSDGPTYSVYKKEMALFTDFGEFPTPQTFTWIAGTGDSNDSAKTLCTGMTQDAMNQLGNVTGAISITIDGGTVAEDVYGGGNESKSLDNTTVTLKGDLIVGRNVFGGGNEADVVGSATVNIIDEE